MHDTHHCEERGRNIPTLAIRVGKSQIRGYAEQTQGVKKSNKTKTGKMRYKGRVTFSVAQTWRSFFDAERQTNLATYQGLCKAEETSRGEGLRVPHNSLLFRFEPSLSIQISHRKLNGGKRRRLPNSPTCFLVSGQTLNLDMYHSTSFFRKESR